VIRKIVIVSGTLGLVVLAYIALIELLAAGMASGDPLLGGMFARRAIG